MMELGNRFGGPAKIRHADSNMVVFDHIMDGKPHTMRVAFHFDGERFMFGKPEGVKPTVVYMPDDEDDADEYGEYSKPSAPMMTKPTGAGNVYEDQYEDDDNPVWMKPKSCGCGGGKSNSGPDIDEAFDTIKSLFAQEVKAGRVISSGNLEKLTQAMDLIREVVASGGRAEIEMKDRTANISANIEDLFGIKQLLEPVFQHHGLSTVANEHGIQIKGLVSDDAMSAIQTALSVSSYDAELVSEDAYSAED